MSILLSLHTFHLKVCGPFSQCPLNNLYSLIKAWMRIIFAEGPRNAINAMTLYSVMQLNLIPNGKHAASNGHTPVVQFFYNVQILAKSNQERAAILFGMLFTLIIWVISALSLAAACLTYIIFLWHYIPSTDRGLSGFCKRKIDSRLQKIVGVKIKKALEKAETNLSKEDLKSGIGRGQLKRQPTLPLLTTEDDDKLPEMPMLSRQTTQATLPPYTARPPPRDHSVTQGLYRKPTLPDLSVDPNRPLPPSRSNTQFSTFSSRSYTSDTPLINGAKAIGFDFPRQSYSATPPSRMVSDLGGPRIRPSVDRITTNMSQRSQRSYHSSSRPPPSAPPTRQNSEFSNCRSNADCTSSLLSRQNTSTSVYSMNARPTPGISPTDIQGRRTPANPVSPLQSYLPTSKMSRHTPIQEYEMHSQPSLNNMHRSPSGNRYIAYNPNMTASPVNAPPMPTSTGISSLRNFTAPNRQPQNGYFPPQRRPPQRSGTAPLPQTATYDDSIYDSYSSREEHTMPRPAIPSRAATISPGGGFWLGNDNGQRQYRPGAY